MMSLSRPARPPRGRPSVSAALRGRDIGVVYAVLVLAVAVVVFLQTHRDSSRIVLDSSTNLANLRDRPLLVLVLSGFVVTSPYGLWILPLLMWGYGRCQRWLGRTATLLVAVFGHIFATVFVAVLLTAGIAHHQLDGSLAREPDVGVSYGLAAVLGVLTCRLPRRRRWIWTVAGTLVVGLQLIRTETFTDLGHTVAWGIGLGIGGVARAATRAAPPHQVSDAGHAAAAADEPAAPVR